MTDTERTSSTPVVLPNRQQIGRVQDLVGECLITLSNENRLPLALLESAINAKEHHFRDYFSAWFRYHLLSHMGPLTVEVDRLTPFAHQIKDLKLYFTGPKVLKFQWDPTFRSTNAKLHIRFASTMSSLSEIVENAEAHKLRKADAFELLALCRNYPYIQKQNFEVVCIKNCSDGELLMLGSDPCGSLITTRKKNDLFQGIGSLSDKIVLFSEDG